MNGHQSCFATEANPHWAALLSCCYLVNVLLRCPVSRQLQHNVEVVCHFSCRTWMYFIYSICMFWFVCLGFFYCRKTSCSSVINTESLPNHPTIQIWFRSKCLSVKWATSPNADFMLCLCSYDGFVPASAGLVISDLSENLLAKG